MNGMNLAQIEKNICLLSAAEQLLLIERIIHRLRTKDVEENEHKWEHKQDTMETQLAEMAADKEIQVELQKINEEFSVTELDGLSKVS
jgi:hypothetical protein